MKNSELNRRQWRLYKYLKQRGNEWTHLKDIAADVYGHSATKFIGTGIQRTITNDIAVINDSGVIQKVIMSDKTKGVKLAGKDEFLTYIKKQYRDLWNRKKRIDNIAKKGLNDKQMRLVFGKERDTIQAFIDGNYAPN